MKHKLIDSHAHLSCDECYPQIESLLVHAKESGVQSIMNICTNQRTLERGLELQEKASAPEVYCIAATTPHDVEKEGESFFPLVEYHAKIGDLVAIGETGLDYHYTHSPREIQHKFLRKYLELAHALDLPVVIHCREAFNDFLQILDEENRNASKSLQGVLHCFTGTLEEAQAVLDRGFYISLSGIVTFPKSTALQQVAQMIPSDKLLIETDTPYLAPRTKRGTPNQPAYIRETAECIADLRSTTIEEIAHITSENANKLFRIGL